MEKEKIKQLIENNIAGQAGMNPYNRALVDVLNALVDNSGDKNWYITVDSETPSFEEGRYKTTAEIAAQFNLSEEDFLKWWNHEVDCISYLKSNRRNVISLKPSEYFAQNDVGQYILEGPTTLWNWEIRYNSTGSPTWRIVGNEQ